MPTETQSSTLDLTRAGIIEASAGTGKTFTIAEIFLALLRGEKGYPAKKTSSVPAKTAFPRVREILVVTFTEAATAELRKRLRERIKGELTTAAETELAPNVCDALRLADAEFDEAAISTIHGFCMRVLQEFGLSSSRTSNVVSNTNDELRRFATRWRAKKIAEGNVDFSKVSATDILGVLAERARRQDAVPVKPTEASDVGANALFLAATEAFEEWKALRSSARDISYSEILTTLLDALRENPVLAKKIAKRFRYAFVDEFQDTDPVQWEIFKRIFLENNRPIFCVGDPKQAIYEFRGGDVRTYRAAREDLKRTSGGNVLTLAENWRSEPETIAAFNEIFAFDKKVSPKDSVGSQKAKKIIEAGTSDLLEYRPTAFPKAKNGKDSGQPSVLLRLALNAASDKDGAKNRVFERIAEDINELVKNRGVPASDIAVLVSENKDATALRARLAKNKIPVSMTAQGNVLCEPIAKDFLDLLRAMLNPRDTARLRRVLISPFFAGTQNELLCDDGSDPEISKKFENLREHFAAAHERWEHAGFLPAFSELSDALGFSPNIATLPTARPLFTNIIHLTEKIHALEQKLQLSPRSLVDVFSSEIASADEKDDSEDLQLRSDSDEPAVRILTVHKSKGLEFKFVFIASLWEKVLLSQKIGKFAKKFDAKNTQELIFDTRERGKKSTEFLTAVLNTNFANEACNFYVALTRARSRVVLYHATKLPGQKKTEPWNSYQSNILSAAGLFEINELGEDSSPFETALPHWKKISISEPLPPDFFPVEKALPAGENFAETDKFFSDAEAEKRFKEIEKTRGKLRGETDGVFSFSSLMRATETEGFSHDDEPSENESAEATDALSAEEKPAAHGETSAFPRTDFFDLPAGPEFGTLVHYIFEKTDFRSRENLDELIENNVGLLPNTGNEPLRERKSKLRKMVEGCLTLPLSEKKIRLETLAENNFVREMEFHFPLKRSRSLYAELAEIFHSWGGIYAETAERLWCDAKDSAAPKLNVGGMMTGVIDLAFKADGKFYILDWKTNLISEEEKSLSQEALRAEIVRHGYALQWSIYALALRKFLQKSLGENYVHDRDFGGIIYFFVRWLAPFVDAGTLTNERLDALAETLFREP